MAKYLDETGLAHLIKKNDARYVRQEAGKGLSANDFTDEYKQMIDDLSYVKIAINSLTATNSSNEIGSTVAATDVAWTLNKEPKTQKIKFSSEAEETLETSDRSKSYTGKNITSNSIIKLTVTDERDASVSKQVTIQFQPKVYYGVSADPVLLPLAGQYPGYCRDRVSCPSGDCLQAFLIRHLSAVIITGHGKYNNFVEICHA